MAFTPQSNASRQGIPVGLQSSSEQDADPIRAFSAYREPSLKLPLLGQMSGPNLGPEARRLSGLQHRPQAGSSAELAVIGEMAGLGPRGCPNRPSIACQAGSADG
jgi:hypothetical protein